MNPEKEMEKVNVLLKHFNCNWNELNRYPFRNGYDDLRSAYASFSWAKQQAFNRCQNLSRWLDGESDSIPSRNSQTFTYNFEFMLFGVRMYAFITKAYNRIGFIGMDRLGGIRELAERMNDGYIYHGMSYDKCCECESLILEMLGKKNGKLKKELEEKGNLERK